MVTKANASAPKPVLKAVAATGGNANEAAPVTETTTKAGAVNRLNKPNIFARQATETTQAVRDKLEIMGVVRQRLAEAADLFSQGDDKAKEATAIAAEVGAKLYQARSGGVITGEEVSATLGDIFGYKPKSDGTPGKTPMGQGEAIRKRVVRAVQADEYVRDGDGGRFFEGLPEVDIKDILDAVEAGAMSIYSAYEKFAEIKREHMVRTDMAFDPKKIAALVESLSNEGAADTLANSPALVAAYGALIEVLNTIGEAAAEAA